MIGKINYGTGGLTYILTESQLPVEGSESTIYYVEETNTFLVWNPNKFKWTRLKTRQNIYLLDGSTLNSKSQEITIVNKNNLTAINSDTTESPDIGDMVFDMLGACGNIVSKDGDKTVNVKTQQSNLTKKVKYDDGSWDMWTSDELNGGHYSWDSTTNILRYEGFNRDTLSPVVYETYSVNGGGSDFDITGGTLIGSRMILAWDGGSSGSGTLRYYYTKNKDNNSFTSNDELATISDVHSILQAESGIYVGIAATEYELNKGIIDGFSSNHVLSENDWAYVMHYAKDVKQYKDNTTFSVGDVIEYNSLLYKVEKEFTKSNWTSDYKNCYDYTGTRCSFIYRSENKEWVLGMEIEQDFPFPDELRLTTDSHNKMTIKSGGVGTNNLANSSVTNPKLANGSVTNDKISDSTIQKAKLDSDLQESITKAETCWYSENFIISAMQPSAPKSGSIIWIDTSTNSL